MSTQSSLSCFAPPEELILIRFIKKFGKGCDLRNPGDRDIFPSSEATFLISQSIAKQLTDAEDWLAYYMGVEKVTSIGGI
jgi:hypothetical protein